MSTINEIFECYYFKPLKLLKITGKCLKNDIVKSKIFRNNKSFLGDAVKDIYVIDINKRSGNENVNLAFTKVVEDLQEKYIYVKSYNNNNELVEELRIEILYRNEIPKEFISTIGSKNGLTVNSGIDKENEYCQKQVACDYKSTIHLLHIESSSLCNLKCQYCIVSNNYEQIERKVITDDVLTAAIKAVNLMPSLKTIQISGLGEPLTNPDFLYMCKRIYNETSIRNVQFFTNGMLFNKEISDGLVDIPLNFKITFSIDGHTAEENSIYRKGSDYEVVKSNVYYFLKKIVGKKNFWIRIHNLLIATQDEDIRTPDFLLNDFGFIQIDSHRAFYFPKLSKETLSQNKIAIYQNKSKKICKRIFSEATIRANGDVIRCHWDSDCSVVMGNVLKEEFSDIWYGEKYIYNRKLMLPDSPFEDLPTSCKLCHAMNEGYLYKE
jgi:radical SAM protein with 4Fe4S-binding SPASM domain